MFLQLLVAQLQNQSPLNPMDPTQFVGQLAQFSELSEVTQIDQLLQKLAPSSTATGSKPPATGDSAESRSTASAPVPAAMLSSAVAAARAAIPNSTSPVAPLLNHKIQGVF
jgi:flagellar basal-body rod modification protein FlgD